MSGGPSDSIKAALLQAATTMAVEWKRIERERYRVDHSPALAHDPVLLPDDLVEQTGRFYEMLANHMDWEEWPPRSPLG